MATDTMKKKSKLWGSAFKKTPSEAVIGFTAGRDVNALRAADYDLIGYDIWLNRAHAVMLAKKNIISKKEAALILKGLEEIESLHKKNKFLLDPDLEDVHTNIESHLTKKFGIEIAGKLHTARSRNDQVVTDTRLYLRDQILNLAVNITELIESLLTSSEQNLQIPVPGFTHRQHAMVTSFGHILHSWALMLHRDLQKLKAVYSIINQNPLGSAAAYGTSFPIDTELTTSYLGFEKPVQNSLDHITNRWEPEADLAYCMTSVLNHLSIISETLIIMTMPEFDMIKLSDEYCTGSSIMPQKKNPDTLEVVKGKASYAHGALMSLISTGKAAMIGYNRDSQWSKYIIMDLIRECLDAPLIIGGIISTMKINKENSNRWANEGMIGATTLLENICATYNIPFRQAKIVIELAIKESAGQKKITLSALKKSLANQGLDIDISQIQIDDWQNAEKILDLYRSEGSPNPKKMLTAIKSSKKTNAQNSNWIIQKNEDKKKALELLKLQQDKILSS